jgi:hypothetical protein
MPVFRFLARAHSIWIRVASLPLENAQLARPRREFVDFPRRLEALGIGNIETLNPAGEQSLLWWIQCVLFPNMPFHFVTYLTAKCEETGRALDAVLEANRDHYRQPIPWTPD